MAKIFPFRAYRYDGDRVRLDAVLLPPVARRGVAAEGESIVNEYNVQGLCSGGGADSEQEAAALGEWVSKGFLRRDGERAFYAYRWEYRVGEETKTRGGFLGLMEVEPLGGGIRAFESHHEVKREAALRLLLATDANVRPVCALYDDPSFRINRLLDDYTNGRAPDTEAIDREGTIHRLWKVDDESSVKRVQRGMADKELQIVAGRAEFEAALAYFKTRRGEGAREIGDESIRNVMTVFINRHAGAGMPEEEPDFHPKPLVGLTINKIELA